MTTDTRPWGPIIFLPLHDDDKVTVCDACMRACCWQGEFMCEGARTAGTTIRTVKQLRDGDYGEHSDYWRTPA